MRITTFGFCAALLAFIAAAPNASAAPLYPEDIIILIDSSGSIPVANYAAIKTFARRINSQLPDRANSRIGVIEYSSGAFTRYNLTGDQTISTIDTTLSNLTHLAGSTYIKTALTACVTMFDAQSDPLSPKAIILLTDNAVPNPSISQDPSSLGPTLASKGIYLLGVGYDGTTFPSSIYTTLATETGGANYVYPTFDDTSADQFMTTDAATYFSLAIVPEPATASLISIGLFGVALRRPKR